MGGKKENGLETLVRIPHYSRIGATCPDGLGHAQENFGFLDRAAVRRSALGRFWNLLPGARGPVVLRKMSRKIHELVEDTPDLHLTIFKSS